MSIPFTKRGKYSWNIYLDKDSFLTLINSLKETGFTNISIKLPLHETTSERGGEKGVTLDDFLDRDRNYKALIVIATNKSEEIRILFKNSGKVEFYDDIFPTANSDLTYNYYISSFDITRTYSLNFFLIDFFKEHKVASVDFFIPITVFVSGVAAIFISQIQKNLNQYSIMVILLVAIFIVTIISVRFLPQTGLYFHNPQDAKPFSTSLQKLKEQLLVLVIGGAITFALGLLGTYIGHRLGW